MPADLAVVFPRAGVQGGVERVTADFLRYEARRRSTCFVGRSLAAEVASQPSLAFAQVTARRTPPALAPLAFRRAAASALARVGARTVVSMGVECPPGDVLWVHSVHAAWLRDGGEVYLRSRRVPPAVRSLLLRHQVLLRLEREYFRRAEPRAVICTSQREIDDLAELYGVPRTLMQAVPNGFDPALFDPRRRERRRSSARAGIGAAPDDVVILVVANEWHRKGLGTLLRAVADLGDERVRVDLVGARTPNDYLALAETLGLGGRCRWHGPSEDVAWFHAAADAFVLATTYEPFGLVIIEAMASGLAVVASALAGASAAIERDVSGIVLDDPRSVPELASALRRLLEPGQRALLGSAAAIAAEPFGRDRVLSAVDRIVFPEP